MSSETLHAPRERLTKEYEMLLAYQSRQRKEIRDTHERELRTLNEKIMSRKAANDEKVFPVFIFRL